MDCVLIISYTLKLDFFTDYSFSGDVLSGVSVLLRVLRMFISGEKDHT